MTTHTASPDGDWHRFDDDHSGFALRVYVPPDAFDDAVIEVSGPMDYEVNTAFDDVIVETPSDHYTTVCQFTDGEHDRVPESEVPDSD